MGVHLVRGLIGLVLVLKGSGLRTEMRVVYVFYLCPLATGEDGDFR